MHKYQNIYTYLSTQIQTQNLKPGEKTPSIRQLASQFQCSKQTVAQALKQLEQQHYIYSKDRSGYYVVDRPFQGEENASTHIDFSNASPNWAHFPYSDFQHCINRAFDTYQRALFSYQLVNGLPTLIDALHNLLTDVQVFAKREQLFITSGIQQALQILSLMPWPNGRKAILLEDPSYPQMIEMTRAYNIPVVRIPRTSEQLDLAQIEQLFATEPIKFFYLTPRFQNPLGFSLSKQDKLKLIQLAATYHVTLVEDDYLADLDPNSTNDPLYALDTFDNVIYLKNFSKIMFPGLRIGAAVLPAYLSATFHRYKQTADIGSGIFSQAALEIHLSSGMFHRHITSLRETAITKTNQFNQAVRSHPVAATLAYFPPKSLKTHLPLPASVNATQLIRACQAQQVYCIPPSRHSVEPASTVGESLFLDLSNVTLSQMAAGTQIILDQLQLLI